MNKKQIQWVVLAVCVIGCVIGIWAYYYNCVQTVTDYTLIKYTPGEEEPSIFGGMTTSAPEVEIESLKKYSSDEAAIKDQNKAFVEHIKFSREELPKLIVKENKTTDNIERLTYAANVKACERLSREERSLLRLTHTRNFKSEDFFNELPSLCAKPWKLDEYIKSHKLDVAVYTLSSIPEK